MKFCIKLERSSMETSDDSEGCCYGQLVIGSFLRTMYPLMPYISRRDFLVKHQITQVTQPSYSPYLTPFDFWFFPKLKSSLKEKKFQAVNEIQENMMGQLMATGRTV